jgi:hypothetical protein
LKTLRIFPDLEKVSFPLRLTKHYALKTYGEVDIQIHLFLTVALAGVEWLASRLGFFTFAGTVADALWIDG